MNKKYQRFVGFLALSLLTAPMYASSDAAEQSQKATHTKQVASVPFALQKCDLPALEEKKGEPYLIFHGHDVAAKHLYYGGKTVFISFMSAWFPVGVPVNPDTRCTFGLPFFQKDQIDSVMVGSFEKMWYQTEEMNELINIINNIVLSLGYTEIVNYGSSMGGFAALAFSKKLSAHKVIALSPQIDLATSIAATGCCKRLNGNFMHTVLDGLSQNSQLYIFYPNGYVPDKNAVQIDLTTICTKIKCSFINLFSLPIKEHVVTGPLARIGLLPKTIMHIKNNEIGALNELYKIDGEVWTKIKALESVNQQKA